MQDYQKGNQKAMMDIFQRYKKRILNFCLSLLGHRADAEEVAADVFLAVIANKHSYDPQRKFSNWIYTIARHKCISLIRKRKSHISFWTPADNQESLPTQNVPQSEEQASQSLIKNETAQIVREAIANLPDEQREAMILRQYHDFSYKEISDILDFSLEKVKILIFRAKVQLKTSLAVFLKEGHDG